MFRAPRPERLLVEDLDIEGVHVRIYRPPGEAPKPGVIYFHGGGWVLGSCETHDDMCAEMAIGADVVVVAVDYRLAPEHRHPAQLEDALKVLDWMREQGRALAIDPSPSCGAGDSAGGQMTLGLPCGCATTTCRSSRPGPDLSGARRRRRHAVLPAQCRSALPDTLRHDLLSRSFLGPARLAELDATLMPCRCWRRICAACRPPSSPSRRMTRFMMTVSYGERN